MSGGRRAATWNGDLDATGLAALRAWQDSRGSRGFTDHEHLNRTGFVHMNGRVFDQRIGRFVSAVPIVQAPWFSQSYNGYAYVFNSPLSHTDPSGFAGEIEHVQVIGRKPNRKLNLDNAGTLSGGSSGSGASSERVRGGGSAGSSVQRRIQEITEQEGPNLEVVEAVPAPDSANVGQISRHDLAVEVGRTVGTEAATLMIDEGLGARAPSPAGSIIAIVVEIGAQAGLDVKDPASMVAVYVSAPIGVVAGGVTAAVIGSGAILMPAVVGFAVGIGVHQLVVRNYEHIAPKRMR